MNTETFRYAHALEAEDGITAFIIESTQMLTAKQIGAICESAYSKPIYWNDHDCYHFIMMFQIDGLWVESKAIENSLQEWRLFVSE